MIRNPGTMLIIDETLDWRRFGMKISELATRVTVTSGTVMFLIQHCDDELTVLCNVRLLVRATLSDVSDLPYISHKFRLDD